MIDHISIGVRSLTDSMTFYDAVLEPLGLSRLVVREATVGYGKRYPEFWINARPGMEQINSETGAHVCLRAPSEDAVRAFHSAALTKGGRCDGQPGTREATLTNYYAAFIRDLDGNRIEAANFPRSQP